MRGRRNTPKVKVTKRLFPHPVLIPELNHSRLRECGGSRFMQMNGSSSSSTRARYVNVARYFISASQTIAKVGSGDDGNFCERAMRFAILITQLAEKNATRRDPIID